MNIKTRVLGAVAALSMMVTGTVHAALPTGATTAFTDIQTDALALLDLVWPAAIAITSGFIVLKIFKRAAGKVG